MSEKSYYQRNGDVMLNTAKEHYKNDKKKVKREIKK